MMDVSRDVAELRNVLRESAPSVLIHVKCLCEPEGHLINVELTPDERKRVVFCWPMYGPGFSDVMLPAAAEIA